MKASTKTKDGLLCLMIRHITLYPLLGGGQRPPESLATMSTLCQIEEGALRQTVADTTSQHPRHATNRYLKRLRLMPPNRALQHEFKIKFAAKTTSQKVFSLNLKPFFF